MSNNQFKILNDLQKGIKIEKESNLKDLVSYAPKSDFPIHRWFKYREGYSIELISSLIQKDDKNILDPFCGCGSTLIGAKLNNKNAIGIDINPVSVLVSKVKLERYSLEDLNNIQSTFNLIIKSRSSQKVEKPILKILDKAFHPEILEQLLKLRYRIDNITNEKVKNFIFLAYISILESLSNTYKEGNGLKYKFTKRTSNGYIRIPIEEWYKDNLPLDKIDHVNKVFSKKINLMISDLKRFNCNNTPDIKVFKGDSKEITNYVKPNTVDLTVFSPPYCNCFDYYEIFKLELWLGGFVNDYKDLKFQRKLALRSNTNSDLSQPVKNFDYLDSLLTLINEKDIWNKKIPSLIRGYFTDMDTTLQEIYNVTKTGGRCVIIVGNSAYGGILIPTDVMLGKIAREIGFDLEKIIVARHLTTSSQQKKKLEYVKDYLRESLVCLKKN